MINMLIKTLALTAAILAVILASVIIACLLALKEFNKASIMENLEDSKVLNRGEKIRLRVMNCYRDGIMNCVSGVNTDYPCEITSWDLQKVSFEMLRSLSVDQSSLLRRRLMALCESDLSRIKHIVNKNNWRWLFLEVSYDMSYNITCASTFRTAEDYQTIVPLDNELGVIDLFRVLIVKDDNLDKNKSEKGNKVYTSYAYYSVDGSGKKPNESEIVKVLSTAY